MPGELTRGAAAEHPPGGSPDEARAGFYPIFLDLRGRRCVVVGGGGVAEGKVEGLLAAGAAVTAISPMISDRLQGWVSQGMLHYRDRAYETGDLAGYEIAFAATGHGSVNHAVYSEARFRGIWINAADDPVHCDFILPAVIRRGELAVAISTGGGSPAAARVIREELENFLAPEYAALVAIASEVRRQLKEKSIAASATGWNAALKGKFRRLLKAGRPEMAKKSLRKALGVDS